MKCLWFLVVALVLVGWTGSTGTVRASERQLETAACEAAGQSGVAHQTRRLIARGFNLPGWTDKWPPSFPDEKLLADLHARGLTHVRLPVRMEALRAQSPDSGRAFSQLDLAVIALLRLGFAVSIDMHSGHQFGVLHRDNPDLAIEQLKEVWAAVASRYAWTSPERIVFEVLNEPDVPAEGWNSRGARVIETIRNAAPRHTIVFGPAYYQRYEALVALKPVNDPNIIYAFHYYDPMAFTHQGMTWSTGPLSQVRGIPFPATAADVEPEIVRLVHEGHISSAQEIRKQFSEPWDESRIGRAFQHVARWIVQHRRPVVLNEFGVLSFAASPASRAAWIRAVRRHAERFCIGWTHWEYADGFGFVRRRNGSESLDPVIGAALVDVIP